MLDLLFRRRSIRRYQQKPVEEQKIRQLVQAALSAPSSGGKNPQKFVVVQDRDLLDKLSRTRELGSSFLKEAPLAIAVLADSKISDVWVEDAAIAATIIHLTAEALGLGSCWIQIRNRKHNEEISAQDYIRNLLDIPEGIQVECLIAVGYPAEQKPARTEDELGYHRVFYNRYSRK